MPQFDFDPSNSDLSDPVDANGLDYSSTDDAALEASYARQGQPAPRVAAPEPIRAPKADRPPQIVNRNQPPASPSYDAAVDEVIEAFDEPQTEFENALANLDQDLDVINHYRLLLNQPLFNGDSQAAIRVENEIKAFVKERLEIFLGRKPGDQRANQQHLTAAPPIFSPDETKSLRSLSSVSADQLTALKAIADKLIKKSEPAAVPAPTSPEPQLNRVQTPSAPTAAVVPAQVRPPARPPAAAGRPTIAPLIRRPRAPGQQTESSPRNIPVDPVVKRRFVEVETVDGTGTRKMDVTRQTQPPAGGPQPQPMPMDGAFQAAMEAHAAATQSVAASGNGGDPVSRMMSAAVASFLKP